MGFGFWPAAILMIVLASWVLYRYVAPKGWREWRSAGLIQAFIIALYAEMYGFPLTLYALTGFFGVDIPMAHPSGHLWAALLGYGMIGGTIEMLLGYAFVLFGIGLLAIGWRGVYQARQEERLATGGLYGLVRHPQYTGIFLALFGQLIHWPTIITLALFPVIVWVYVRLARREETQMTEQFGAAYDAYRKQVPMFFPRWGTWREFFNTACLLLGKGQREQTLP
jgi:protein-S-isoprenylcysteine O-methyltransferase Ste14